MLRRDEEPQFSFQNVTAPSQQVMLEEVTWVAILTSRRGSAFSWRVMTSERPANELKEEGV